MKRVEIYQATKSCETPKEAKECGVLIFEGTASEAREELKKIGREFRKRYTELKPKEGYREFRDRHLKGMYVIEIVGETETYYRY